MIIDPIHSLIPQEATPNSEPPSLWYFIFGRRDKLRNLHSESNQIWTDMINI
jgi:hypothetical protein